MNYSLKAITILALMAALRPRRRLRRSSPTQGWIDIFPNPSLKGWSRAAIRRPTGKDFAGWKVDRASRTLLCEGDKLGHEWLRWARN